MNPGRLYFKRPKRQCDIFQWVGEPPKGKTRAWLTEGRKLWLETPLQQGVDRIVKRVYDRGIVESPFEGNWKRDDDETSK